VLTKPIAFVLLSKYLGIRAWESLILYRWYAHVLSWKKLLHFYHTPDVVLHMIGYIYKKSSRFIDRSKLLDIFYRLYSQLVSGTYQRKPLRLTTQDLPLGHLMTLKIADGHLVTMKIILNNDTGITCSTQDHAEIARQNAQISFWYDSQGYQYEAEVYRTMAQLIHIDHGYKIVPKQRRRYRRFNVQLTAVFCIMLHNNTDKRYVWENSHGVEAEVQDISYGGFSIMAQGQGRSDIEIKAQVKVNDTYIVLSGIVRSVSYFVQKNQSILHVQFYDDIPFGIKEPILSYVYDLNT
jgi:hypothetical protein